MVLLVLIFQLCNEFKFILMMLHPYKNLFLSLKFYLIAYDVIVTSMIFSTNDGYLHEFINIFTFHWKIDELIGGFRIVLSVICKLKVYVLKRDKWFGGFTKQPWFNLVVSRCNLQLSLSSINCMQQKHPINDLFSLNLNIYFYDYVYLLYAGYGKSN